MYAQRTSLKYSPTSVRRACALIQVSRSALEEIAGRNRGYGQKLKALTVIDEWTRDCLAIEVASSLKATRVIAVLERLFETHGAPAVLRSDNGPEFIANAVKAWLAASGIGTDYIEPGSPWENAYSESFNSRFRDELLDRELFSSLLEARVLIEEHRTHYNHGRVHSSLGYLTPFEFAAQENKKQKSKASAKGKAKATSKAVERAA